MPRQFVREKTMVFVKYRLRRLGCGEGWPACPASSGRRFYPPWWHLCPFFGGICATFFRWCPPIKGGPQAAGWILFHPRAAALPSFGFPAVLPAAVPWLPSSQPIPCPALPRHASLSPRPFGDKVPTPFFFISAPRRSPLIFLFFIPKSPTPQGNKTPIFLPKQLILRVIYVIIGT